jgi:SAM-dependent methyltransferase
LHAHGIDDAELRRRYAQVFDDVAEDYDRERRGYPDELIDAACDRGGLRTGDAVVEVGCGTGLLTTSLLARGLHVEAIDPGANMIRLARRRVGEGAKVRFHHARFEDLAPPEGPFAAVFSATAFHWIEPAVGWARAAGLLAPGGILALLQYCPAWDARTADDWQALVSAVGQVAPEIAAGWPGLRDRDAIMDGAAARRTNISQLWSWIGNHDLAVPDAARLYDHVEVSAVPVYTERTGEQLNAVLRTMSVYARIPRERRAEFEAANLRVAERLGGVVRSSELAVLATARRA